MPSVFDLTASPVNLSATLAVGTYLCQFQGPVAGFYGAFPASGSDPTDTAGMFAVGPDGFFVVNVGGTHDPVWVAGVDLGANVGVGKLVIEDAA